MKQLNANFIIGISNIKDLPKIPLPIVAFAGRSNVGKSSLINCILTRKNLARTSSTPGKTQQINLYQVEEDWILADMPGFGYAKTSKTNRIYLSKVNLKFLEQTENLKLVFYLVDSRVEPMEIDLALIEFLENSNKRYIIILTKTDKINENILTLRITQYKELTQYCRNIQEILPFSSKTKRGKEELVAIIKKVNR